MSNKTIAIVITIILIVLNILCGYANYTLGNYKTSLCHAFALGMAVSTLLNILNKNHVNNN